MLQDSRACPSCGAPLGVAADGAGLTLPPPPSELPHGPSRPTRPRVNGAWWLLPILFGWLGGLIAYIVNRKADPATARAMLVVGIALNVLGAILVATLPFPR